MGELQFSEQKAASIGNEEEEIQVSPIDIPAPQEVPSTPAPARPERELEPAS